MPRFWGWLSGKGATRHQRGDHRDAGQLGQVHKLLGGLAADDAAADVEHRFTGRRDQLGGLADLAVVRLGVRLVARQLDPRRPAERALSLQNILGNVDQHRSWPAGRGDVERLGHHPRDVVAVAHQEVVLGDRHRDARDIGFLEGVGADQPATDLPGDRDHRDRIHVGVGERSDQIGGAGPRRRHAHTDLAGGVGVPTGRMSCALLVSDEDVTEPLRVEKWVVDRQYGTPRNAEDDVDVELLQRPDNRLCSGELLGGNLLGLARRAVTGCRRCGFRNVGRGLLPARRGRRPIRGSGGWCAHDVLICRGFVWLFLWTLKSLLGQQKTPASEAAVRGLRVDTGDYARVRASAVSTRNPITTSNPRFCTTVDGSLRTGQPSNSFLPTAPRSGRRAQWDDGRRDIAIAVGAGRTGRDSNIPDGAFRGRLPRAGHAGAGVRRAGVGCPIAGHSA